MSLSIVWRNNTIKYDQLYSTYPHLAQFYPFQTENNWVGFFYADFCKETMLSVVYLSTFYLLAVYLGRSFMEKNKPFDLKYSLAFWNLSLSLFSFCGALRTLPHLINNIYLHGYQWSVCTKAEEAFGCGPSGMWTTLFVFSKIPELFDTLFIVLRKKPLIFLHWYHHVTVLLYCWHAYATRASTGLYFVAVNYSVHAVMYFYYFLAGLRKVPRWLNPLWITSFQVSQMVLGIVICASVFIYKVNGTKCEVHKYNLLAAGAMYASYFYLFLQYLIKRYHPIKVKKA